MKDGGENVINLFFEVFLKPGNNIKRLRIEWLDSVVSSVIQQFLDEKYIASKLRDNNNDVDLSEVTLLCIYNSYDCTTRHHCISLNLSNISLLDEKLMSRFGTSTKFQKLNFSNAGLTKAGFPRIFLKKHF